LLNVAYLVFVYLLLLQGGPGCDGTDWSAADNVQVRRKRDAVDNNSNLLQKLRKRMDLPKSWLQNFDYDTDSDYFGQPDQGAMLPYKRKRKGRCYRCTLQGALLVFLSLTLQ